MKNTTISKMQRDKAELSAIIPKTKPKSKSHKTWTPEEDNKITILWLRRYTLKGIASITGRSVAAVEKRLRDIKAK